MFLSKLDIRFGLVQSVAPMANGRRQRIEYKIWTHFMTILITQLFLYQMEEGKVNLELKLTDVRSHESGVFMCWREGQKPDPQVMVTILGESVYC